MRAAVRLTGRVAVLLCVPKAVIEGVIMFFQKTPVPLPCVAIHEYIVKATKKYPKVAT